MKERAHIKPKRKSAIKKNGNKTMNHAIFFPYLN